MVNKKVGWSSWLLGLMMMAMPVAAQDAADPNEIEPPVSEAAPLADVPREHWAYQALLRLTQRYGCIAGYADGTFRGDQPISRNEFAAGLNACLNILTTPQAAQQPVSPEEFETLRESVETFQQDLNDLSGGRDISE